MRPVIPLADVTMYGALDPEGEVYPKCRITLNGSPADAVLYSKLMGAQRWKPVDRLTAATVTEHGDGTLTIVGTSQELIELVGVAPSNATVRWEVRPRGCQNCH